MGEYVDKTHNMNMVKLVGLENKVDCWILKKKKIGWLWCQEQAGFLYKIWLRILGYHNRIQGTSLVSLHHNSQQIMRRVNGAMKFYCRTAMTTSVIPSSSQICYFLVAVLYFFLITFPRPVIFSALVSNRGCDACFN